MPNIPKTDKTRYVIMVGCFVAALGLFALAKREEIKIFNS